MRKLLIALFAFFLVCPVLAQDEGFIGSKEMNDPEPSEFVVPPWQACIMEQANVPGATEESARKACKGLKKNAGPKPRHIAELNFGYTFAGADQGYSMGLELGFLPARWIRLGVSYDVVAQRSAVEQNVDWETKVGARALEGTWVGPYVDFILPTYNGADPYVGYRYRKAGSELAQIWDSAQGYYVGVNLGMNGRKVGFNFEGAYETFDETGLLLAETIEDSDFNVRGGVTIRFGGTD